VAATLKSINYDVAMTFILNNNNNNNETGNFEVQKAKEKRPK